jgi:hypothetical protein
MRDWQAEPVHGAGLEGPVALACYTEVLGFIKKHAIPLGEAGRSG